MHVHCIVLLLNHHPLRSLYRFSGEKSGDVRVHWLAILKRLYLSELSGMRHRPEYGISIRGSGRLACRQVIAKCLMRSIQFQLADRPVWHQY